MSLPNDPSAPSPRAALRQQLLASREAFVASAAFEAAQTALQARLVAVLSDLVPECLGIYWPLGSEFNAARPWLAGDEGSALPLALPFAQREPRRLTYRRWNGSPPELKDDCGIAASGGAPVAPDVVLVPCLGYTDGGFRLGYGGGYYDRYLAEFPDVTAIGVAWSVSRVDAAQFAAEAHDRPMMLIVTEQGIVG
ncbi:MAG: hypothetical protein RLZZ618_1596 [Pseudomonadota bacterium]